MSARYILVTICEQLNIKITNQPINSLTAKYEGSKWQIPKFATILNQFHPPFFQVLISIICLYHLGYMHSPLLHLISHIYLKSIQVT